MKKWCRDIVKTQIEVCKENHFAKAHCVLSFSEKRKILLESILWTRRTTTILIIVNLFFENDNFVPNYHIIYKSSVFSHLIGRVFFYHRHFFVFIANDWFANIQFDFSVNYFFFYWKKKVFFASKKVVVFVRILFLLLNWIFFRNHQSVESSNRAEHKLRNKTLIESLELFEEDIISFSQLNARGLSFEWQRRMKKNANELSFTLQWLLTHKTQHIQYHIRMW